MKYSNLLRKWIGGFLLNVSQNHHNQKNQRLPKTTSVCVHWIYLIHKFHNLSWITEINELFHDILISWDAPVYLARKAVMKLTSATKSLSKVKWPFKRLGIWKEVSYVHQGNIYWIKKNKNTVGKPLLQSSAPHDSSEIIIICWFGSSRAIL